MVPSGPAHFKSPKERSHKRREQSKRINAYARTVDEAFTLRTRLHQPYFPVN